MNIKYRLLCKRLRQERKRVGVIQYYNVLFIMELMTDKDIWCMEQLSNGYVGGEKLMSVYQIPEEYFFRIHHCRPRFKGNVENVLIYIATEITRIGDAPKDEFNNSLNNAIKCFPGNSTLALKTVNNWRTDEKGMLFFEMCRILRERKPKCFIAENVKGLLTANKKEAFPLIIKEFEESGYNVTYHVLKAVEYGVPQKRERVIIVGFKKELGIKFDFPNPVIKREEDYVPLKEVIEANVDEKYFFSQRAVDGMMRNRATMNKGRAQNIEEPCNTVGAHLAKVSLNSTDPVLMEGGRYRRFTPREVARIQSFPDTFKLIESESAQYRALGNAIPPVMFWYVMRAVKLALEQ